MRKRGPAGASSLVVGALALAATLVVLGLMIRRMRYGLDWTDEAFYVSLPARFVQGDRPFADELNVAQNAGIFLWPFFKVYSWFKGWTGIFAFVRVLFITFFILVGWSAYSLAVAARLRAPAALLCGAACICFIPFGLPGLSYNTLGTGFSAIGLFTAARAMLGPRIEVRIHRDLFFWAGVAQAAAAFAYPTLLLATISAGLAIFALAEARWRSLFRFVLGGLAFALLVSPLFIRAGIGPIREMAEYCLSDRPAKQETLLNGLLRVWAQWQALNPDFWKNAAGISAALLLARRWPFVVGLALPLAPLLVRQPPTGITTSLFYFGCFALYGPLFALAIVNRKVARTLVVAVTAPAMVAGIAFSLSSGNGAPAAGTGLYPGGIVSAILFAYWIQETSTRWSWAFLRPLAQLAPVTFLYVVAQNTLADDNVYRDSPIPLLTAKMTDGPYKGLYTTPAKKAWLEMIGADIRKYRSGKRTLFYYDFPAGYLYADQPPIIVSTWVFSFTTHRAGMESRHFRDTAEPGENVFRFGGGFNPTGTSLDAAVAERCKLMHRGPDYGIWVVQPRGAVQAPE